MTIELVFITYQRLEYTKLALASVLADPTEEFSLTIWDNASTDGTPAYLRNEVSDPRIADIVLSKENVGQTAAVNEVWGRSKADLLGKLDNDCIVTPGWTRTLAQAHRDIEPLGVVACWHFFSDDFDYDRARHKIQTFGSHRIFRHPWTCGTGLLIKKTDFQDFGPIPGQATTQYWLRMAAAGRINGFYYPLIYQEHMDDPKSRHCLMHGAGSFERYREVTFGLCAGRYHDMDSRMTLRREVVRNLLEDPFAPQYYLGWRRKMRSLRARASRLLSWPRARRTGSGRR
ncbi:glycosyltransferase family 2 protein [Anaerobaca lacustris]|uniref:Glycosyltransferase n=1 Tax=Anaerobaca lacustris TaxID=3044600 RepID=A0AAW6U254_9BACT|nr:glycosyltransferase [Sedimentisphaerales bacterium M17dextr]